MQFLKLFDDHLDRRPSPALSLVQELVEAEFARLARAGAFSFASGERPGL